MMKKKTDQNGPSGFATGSGLAAGCKDLFERLVTPSIEQIAIERLATGTPLIRRGEVLIGERRMEIKLALIYVHKVNAWEKLGAEEEALFRGISADTVARHRSELKRL